MSDNEKTRQACDKAIEAIAELPVEQQGKWVQYFCDGIRRNLDKVEAQLQERIERVERDIALMRGSL